MYAATLYPHPISVYPYSKDAILLVKLLYAHIGFLLSVFSVPTVDLIERQMILRTGAYMVNKRYVGVPSSLIGECIISLV